jgi:hypothetical protein
MPPLIEEEAPIKTREKSWEKEKTGTNCADEDQPQFTLPTDGNKDDRA